MKKTLLIVSALICFGCQQAADQPAFPDGTWLDLSYDYSSETIYWPTSEPFRFDTVFAGHTEAGFYYTAYQFCSAEHGGTHMDAPIHFSEGKKSVDQLPIEQLVGPAVVIDVSTRALRNPDYLVSVDDIRLWESSHGKLADGQIVLLKTGYGQFWPDAEKYMGTAERGPEAVAKLHFPGLAPAAATWLVENRNIRMIGLDTPSIDYGQSTLYESHQILFEANISALENVANLDKLPLQGAYVIALPMKIKDGSGGPVRIAAWIPPGNE